MKEMPRPVGPSGNAPSRPSFVSGTADTMDRQIKKKKQEVYQQTLANLAKLQQDEGGGGFGFGDAMKMVGGLVVSPAATALDTMDWANQQLVKYVAGKEPEDQYDPGTANSVNLFGETYRGIDAGLQRAAGDIAATPGIGKPSASPTASDIRKYGVLEGVARAGVDYGNLALTAYPVIKPGVVKAVGATSDLVNAMKLARIERELNPFPRITTPSSFIDVVEGSRLPARVVDAPAPTTPYGATRAALAEDMAVTAPDTSASAGLASTALQDLAQAQARNATHIGTVSRGPVGTLSSKPFNKLESMTWQSGGLPNAASRNMQQVDIPVFEIGGKRIAFGDTRMLRYNPEFDVPGVEFVSINPYEITKLSPTSAEGQAAALQFSDALNGRIIESLDQGARNINTNDMLQVPALQYAAAQGDDIALAELERLAKVGRDLVNQKRLAEAMQEQQYISSFLAGRTWDQVRGIQVAVGKDATGQRVLRPVGIDDLFVVHQTRFKPPVDADGNVVLNPSHDFVHIDPATGKPYVDPVTGQQMSPPNRHTIHFALNHLAGGHIMRTVPTQDTYAVIVPLRDILDANRGSLDNLYAVDTFFTPKPGEGLTLPMKNGRVVQLSGLDRYGTGTASPDIMERLISDNNRVVSDAMNEVGAAHNNYPQYEVLEFPDYAQYSDQVVDRRIRELAVNEVPNQYTEYGPLVDSALHANSTIKQFEDAVKGPVDTNHSVWMMPTDGLSPNARLRIFNTKRFGSGKVLDASLAERGL